MSQSHCGRRGFLNALLVCGTLAVALVSLSASGCTAAEAAAPTEAVTEPDAYRTDEYRKPVPATLRGAAVLSSEAASALWSTRTAIFIDVYPHAPKPLNLPADTLWREPAHYSIEDAIWLPNVGYGVLSEATESFFKARLAELSGGDKGKPLVFFCLRNCWMSWNAAKRALTYGYTAVNWYPDGSDGWQEIGGLVVETTPEPQPQNVR